VNEREHERARLDRIERELERQGERIEDVKEELHRVDKAVATLLARSDEDRGGRPRGRTMGLAVAAITVVVLGLAAAADLAGFERLSLMLRSLIGPAAAECDATSDMCPGPGVSGEPL